VVGNLLRNENQKKKNDAQNKYLSQGQKREKGKCLSVFTEHATRAEIIKEERSAEYKGRICVGGDGRKGKNR
jgi:hypothetical protein